MTIMMRKLFTFKHMLGGTWIHVPNHQDMDSCYLLRNIASRLEVITLRLEVIALRLEVIALRLEVIALRLEAIALRVEAIAL